VCAQLKAGLLPKRLKHPFDRTADWEITRSGAGNLPRDSQGHRDIFMDRLLDDLRLESDSYDRRKAPVPVLRSASWTPGRSRPGALL